MKKGFSLLEILIALAVMLVGIVGILSLFPVGLRSSKVAENYTLAAILAQQVLEEKLIDYSSLSDASGTFSSPDDKFSWNLVVTQPVSNLKKLALTISWNDLGTTINEEFVTYRANY